MTIPTTRAELLNLMADAIYQAGRMHADARVYARAALDAVEAAGLVVVVDDMFDEPSPYRKGQP